MSEMIPVVNPTMELSECRDRWTWDETYGCWCLEDVLYTPRAAVPKFQRLSIFAPAGCMNPDGTPTGAGRKAPVVFENNAAGYVEMPHTWLGGPRNYAEQYLAHGLIYVTCGCRGRNSRGADGRAAGKAPVTLTDLKTAIRFLRHNRAALPGDYDRIISVGWSAGGAMSSLLGVTGDSPRYDPWLEASGAFMDESDAVYAAQIYCPIIDLEHADMAYEWCFVADKTCEDSPAGPAETLKPFQEALSIQLAAQYADYVNGLRLRHPQTGEPLTLDRGGRSGSFYRYMMDCLDASAADFLSRLESGRLPRRESAEAYLCGRYTEQVPGRIPVGRMNPALHHAGPGVGIPESGDRPARMPALGDLMSRPPRGVPYRQAEPPMVTRQGTDKRDWLRWDGERAEISDLDTYVLRHRRRMKPCTAFDKLGCDSGENQEFGTGEPDYVHFSPAVGQAVAALREVFPEEAARYGQAFAEADGKALAEQVYLLNPMNFIGTGEICTPARYYRVRVGACDADTSLSVAMTLALRLQNAGFPADFALVWDQPHSEADYPGEILRWIDGICG